MNTGGIYFHCFCKVGAETGGIQEGTGAKDAARGELGDCRGAVGHEVEGVGDHEDEGVGGVLNDLGDGVVDDRAVYLGQIEAGLPRFLGTTGGKDNEVGALQIFETVCRGNGCAREEGHTVLEISLFTLCFFNLSGIEDEVGDEAF